MTKELENVKQGIEYIKNSPLYNEDIYTQEAIYYIENYLVPPTSEQVCKELSEYLGKPVIYIKDSKSFLMKGSNGKYELVKMHYDKEIKFDSLWTLPPHLIELIAKFYKGVLENEN